MRIAAVADNLIERIAMWLGLVPTPIIETFHAPALARCIMAATKLGVFEALAEKQSTAESVAQELGIDRDATAKLLNVLVNAGYAEFRAGHYKLTKVTRRWLLRRSPTPLRDHVIFRYLEWEAIERLEDFVRTGDHLDVHDQLSPEQWETYQRGMRSIAGMSASEVATRVPVPRGATNMLDIGGSHGYYSVSFCRRHVNLTSKILELPQAIEFAAPILADEQMGDRVLHCAGNALTDDLGEDQYDFVFISHLIHHFDAQANQQLFHRIARALRAGGVLAILDAQRLAQGERAGQTGALLDLFFAMTSHSGAWSESEVHAWIHGAGLRVDRTIVLRTAPGLSVFVGRKG